MAKFSTYFEDLMALNLIEINSVLWIRNKDLIQKITCLAKDTRAQLILAVYHLLVNYLWIFMIERRLP